MPSFTENFVYINIFSICRYVSVYFIIMYLYLVFVHFAKNWAKKQTDMYFNFDKLTLTKFK